MMMAAQLAIYKTTSVGEIQELNEKLKQAQRELHLHRQAVVRAKWHDVMPNNFSKDGRILARVPDDKPLPFPAEIFRFEAGGKTWHVETKLTMKRRTFLMPYQLKATWGYTPYELHQHFMKMLDAIYKLELRDAGRLGFKAAFAFTNTLVQVCDQLQNFDERIPEHQIIAGVFINETNEDRSDITLGRIMEKREIWNAASKSHLNWLTDDFFLRVAKNAIAGIQKISKDSAEIIHDLDRSILTYATAPLNNWSNDFDTNTSPTNTETKSDT